VVAPGALPGTPGAVASPRRGKRPGPITCRRTPAGGRRRLPRQSLTVVSYEGKVLGFTRRPSPGPPWHSSCTHRLPVLCNSSLPGLTTPPCAFSPGAAATAHRQAFSQPPPPRARSDAPPRGNRHDPPRLRLPARRHAGGSPRPASVSAPRAPPRCRLPVRRHGAASPRPPPHPTALRLRHGTPRHPLAPVTRAVARFPDRGESQIIWRPRSNTPHRAGARRRR